MGKPKRKLKERPYAGGRYTEARFWGFIRSALRQKSTRWPPIYDVLEEARRPSKSKNKRLKWEYQCAKCKKWWPQKEVSVDHIIPTGSLKSFDDIPGFVERLFCEKDGLQVLCDGCHNVKTAAERLARKGEKIGREE